MSNPDLRKKRVAIIGGGPSGLFVLKRFVKSNSPEWEIHIFEKSGEIGPGMPYSSAGACQEHVTNVSDNEVPELVTDIKEWIRHEPKENLLKFGVEPEKFHEYKVLPRLLFGKYLRHQFNYLRDAAKKNDIALITHYNCEVTDVIDVPDQHETTVVTNSGETFSFDHVIICTGHSWNTKYEGVIPNYFESPYPPAKLNVKLNHPVAIRGASLSAIDAIKTLARTNGTFSDEDGKIRYRLAEGSDKFKIVMHSRNGLLPAFRFHLEQSSPSERTMLTENEITENRAANEGFLSLDYVFEKKFKEIFRERDPEFYEKVKGMSLEQFTDAMVQKREAIEPFTLFYAEYKEAEKSIQRKESVHWKEALAELSFILNYPAKYLSAEDMLRLRNVLMPLISVIIAFIPQSSGQELMSLHEADVLSLKVVGADSTVVPEATGGATYRIDEPNGEAIYYDTYVDCVGQSHFHFEDFPFRSLIDSQTITGARIKFRSLDEGQKFAAEHTGDVERDAVGNLYLRLPGIAINDRFQVIDKFGSFNERIYVMAVPFISGYNPDYSGLDFCERASDQIVTYLLQFCTPQ
jgi:uncharacterized NAD(P)/FAD-binding protein YdhS